MPSDSISQSKPNLYGHKFSPEFTRRYEITGILGEGGMGQVLRGKQVELGREVAIKLLTTRSYATPERLQRFKDEAQRCAGMRHPNLVEVYDYGEEGERPYMVMELIDGESLADRLKRDGKVPIKDALKIGVEICEGLMYAHAKGLVHRDIKSDNILLDKKEGRVKVADFGIAVASDGNEKEKENAIIGTPSYMSPEQASGKKADARSDIYSTGVILYEMLCGKVPFTGETSMAIIIKHLNEKASSLRGINPEIPVQVEELVLRALEKEAERRYQTAQEFSQRLKKAISLVDSWSQQAKKGGPGGTRSMTSVTQPVSVFKPPSEDELRKKRLLISLAVVAGLGLVGGIGWWAVFAPPSYQASEAGADVGFTEAEVRFNSSHPCPTKVEYRPLGEEAGQEAGKDVQGQTHKLLLEGLKEDSTYQWRALFPAGQFGPWNELHTSSLEFKDVSASPRVGGSYLTWRTSVPVEMEVQYVQDGKVKEIIHLEGVRSEHKFTASFPDPSNPYQVRLRAILNQRFSKTHNLTDIPTLDLGEVDRLAEAVDKVVACEDPNFFHQDVFKRWKSLDLAGKVERFKKIRELFYGDPQVPSQKRMDLVASLGKLRELDVFLAWAQSNRDKFDSLAAEAFGPGYLAGTSPPFPGGAPVEIALPARTMAYDFEPPALPISGGLPLDSKDSVKFEIPAGALGNAQDGYLELRMEKVESNCFFQVELTHQKRPSAVLSFLPSLAVAAAGKSYEGTWYARFDPRWIHPKKPILGWLKLRILRNSISPDPAEGKKELERVRADFVSLKVWAK